MFDVRWTSIVFIISALACASGLTAANAAVTEPHADELSSVQWRDCAGHFMFLASMLGKTEDKKASERLNSWGVLAIYASETKARAEARAGTTKDGLGESLADPKTGKLKVDVQGMLSEHTARAEKQGQKAYLEAYAAQCAKPIQAYSKRFMESVQSTKQ